MTYNADLTWIDLSKTAGAHARQVMLQLREGKAAYDEWQNFRASRSDADIATALGVAESLVADLDSCFAAMSTLQSFADNGAESQGDYLYALRKFA